MTASTESENQITQLQQENELLLLQLHQVQEELEHYFLLYKECEAKSPTVQTAGLTQSPGRKKTQLWVDRLPRNLVRILRRTTLVKKSILRNSEFFDEAWYLQAYPDVAQRRKDPVAHYLRHGAKEGRNPGPNFDTQWYLSYNPDVAKLGVNPLLHYLQFGQTEGRLPSPLGIQPPEDPFAGERQRLKRDRDEQARLASERLQCIENLTTANEAARKQCDEFQRQIEAARKQCDELERQIEILVKERDEQVKLAEDRAQKIKQLETELADTQVRQTLLNEEMIKAGAQIDLIKELILEEEVE